MAAIKIRDMIKKLTADGWVLARQNGSHRQFSHPIKKGIVTVVGKPNADLDKGTEKSILSQAKLEEEKK
jgi:predicted RNA binding protein YcfA (HicA-like mRNA interferase family)